MHEYRGFIFLPTFGANIRHRSRQKEQQTARARFHRVPGFGRSSGSFLW